MATDEATIPADRESPETVQSTVSSIKRMLKAGAVFVAVGYLLIIGALVEEFTQFHPAIESFFSAYPNPSLGGAAPGDRRTPTARWLRYRGSPRPCCG